MDKKKISIAIPASTISDTPHLREKTAKIGLIGRSAAIFRVDEIIIYPDVLKADQQRDLDFIALLLGYLETPQYLRKRLFKLEPELEFAGIFPPLRTPHHPLSGKTKHLQVGEYREGVILSENKEGLVVDIGVQQPALLRQKLFAVGDRLTLQIVNIGKLIEVQTANREDIPVYWGYKVRIEKRSFRKMVTEGNFDLRIATARAGDHFMSVLDKIGEKWRSSGRVLVAFGAPSRGLHEIAGEEGMKLEAIVDFVVNMIPEQGTATVRTEEALLASLAILNMQFG
ncbi:MAG TPA: putative RNA uridine N3 methyltransferase [Candidatus Acidoferrum sp.]|nr:putative RNA uridine N3 methyltransferase [Candidatus Acidoferrum sp.]